MSAPVQTAGAEAAGVASDDRLAVLSAYERSTESDAGEPTPVREQVQQRSKKGAPKKKAGVREGSENAGKDVANVLGGTARVAMGVYAHQGEELMAEMETFRGGLASMETQIRDVGHEVEGGAADAAGTAHDQLVLPGGKGKPSGGGGSNRVPASGKAGNPADLLRVGGEAATDTADRTGRGVLDSLKDYQESERYVGGPGDVDTGNAYVDAVNPNVVVKDGYLPGSPVVIPEPDVEANERAARETKGHWDDTRGAREGAASDADHASEQARRDAADAARRAAEEAALAAARAEEEARRAAEQAGNAGGDAIDTASNALHHLF